MPPALVPTGLVTVLTFNHVVLGGRLSIDILAIACVMFYYAINPPSRRRP